MLRNLTIDVTILPQFNKIKEISDLSIAILADGLDFGFKKMQYKQHMKVGIIRLKLTK